MKAELKARWIAALRSGNYKQGKGFLRTDEGHCCLGVLCDLLRPDRWVQSRPGSYFQMFSEGGTLPQPIAHEAQFETNPWVEVPFDDPVWDDDRLSDVNPSRRLHLTSLNDRHLTFLEIADLLEKYLPVTP